MQGEVQIKLLGACSISAGKENLGNLAAKSRKGASLMEYLILQRGKPVSVHRLIREIWDRQRSESPEGALKTLISRLRALLNDVAPGLGGSIVSGQGTYRWESLPGVHVDVLEMLDLLDTAKKENDPDGRRETYRRVIDLYEGDLVQAGDTLNSAMQVNWLHREYLDAVYAYIELLKETEEYNEICRVCDRALRVDDLDEHLHIEMMRAMVSLNRMGDADAEYRRITRLSRQYLDADPSEEMQENYRKLAEEGASLKFNLDRIRNELMEKEGERHGPFFCDYAAFKEIYNIQMRNLERLGSSMFLGVITVGNLEEKISSVSRESAMAGLTEILRNNLRKGDIVTRFAPAVLAMLLPTVNYATGGMVMERIEHLFYEEYPSKGINLHYRISPLGGEIGRR